MATDQYPDQYLVLNSQASKNLVVAMQIEGVQDLYGASETYTKIRYGDPNLLYGVEGARYGGLRRNRDIKDYLVLDSSMTIGQKIEPEQGRGNIGTLSITLIDKNGEISRLISPGIVVDELISKREVKIWLGYKQSSFPEDYLLVYKGYITSITCPQGVVKFQISDATSKKRQPLFNISSTNLNAPLDAVSTNIPVNNTNGFHQQILGPDGEYDPLVKTLLRIDDEILEYGPAGIVGPNNFTASRGQIGTSAALHEFDAQVKAAIQLGDFTTGTNSILLALKLLLSGWNGPCETGINILSFVYSYNEDGDLFSNCFVLSKDAFERPYDAKKDLGLTVGDYFYISGASESANNISGIITDILLIGDRYQLILTDQTFVEENPSTAQAAFRSKYDTLPTTCGLKLRMRDVDVETIETIQSRYFVSSTAANMSLYYEKPKQGKDIIDTDIFLPLGCYGISRFGRISMSVTKPPLPGIGKLVEINWNHVLDPDKIIVTRATNQRTFYNLISFEYNYVPGDASFTTIKQFLDTDSLNLLQQASALPIQSLGLRDNLGGGTIAQSRGRALLNRFKKCALVIDLTVNWSVGSLIEVSDIVLVRDEGRLKIMNFETGERNIGAQLFEVIDRQYNIMAGNVKLKLMGGLGFNVDSRFALYSPSSQLTASSTSSAIQIKPSYGQPNISKEIAKWTPYIGMPVEVHSFDYSDRGTTTFVGFSPTDASVLLLDPPLSFTPTTDYILDIAPYPTSTDKNEQSIYKYLFAHFSPSIPVVSGVSGTQFNVSLSDAAKMTIGNVVIVRNSDYSVISDEIKVSDITGTLITLASDLGFTPSSANTVEGVGFKDGLGFYRWG